MESYSTRRVKVELVAEEVQLLDILLADAFERGGDERDRRWVAQIKGKLRAAEEASFEQKGTKTE